MQHQRSIKGQGGNNGSNQSPTTPVQTSPPGGVFSAGMAPKPWAPIGLSMIMLALIFVSLPLPADSKSCVEMIGNRLVTTMRDKCLLAFNPSTKPGSNPVAEKECCQAVGKGLERSRGNRCLCNYMKFNPGLGGPPVLGGPTMAELCKLSERTKQICGS